MDIEDFSRLNDLSLKAMDNKLTAKERVEYRKLLMKFKLSDTVNLIDSFNATKHHNYPK